MEQCRCQTFTAKVICIKENSLLVCDCRNDQEIIVHTNKACCFTCGDCVCVHYSGVMAMSNPPQVTAKYIEKCFSNRCW